jgi:hypothetical protein
MSDTLPSRGPGDQGRSLPGNLVRVNLELLDQHRFRNGTV